MTDDRSSKTIFDVETITKIYDIQTDLAKRHNLSNCPRCAVCDNENSKKIYGLNEMRMTSEDIFLCLSHIK